MNLFLKRSFLLLLVSTSLTITTAQAQTSPPAAATAAPPAATKPAIELPAPQAPIDPHAGHSLNIPYSKPTADVETAPEAQKPLNEGLGLFTSAQQGGLGSTVWQDLPREDLYNMINDISPSPPSRSLYYFTLRVLLTDIDPQTLKGTAPEPDFLTHRIQKLNQIGAFEKVADLYAKAADQKLSAPLAEAGLAGLIGNNNASVACLESKVHPEASGQDEFWVQLSQLCKGLVEKPADGPSAVIKSAFADAAFRLKPASWEDLSKMSVVERGALILKNKIDYSALVSQKPDVRFPSTLMQVFGDRILPPALKIQLAAALANSGLLTGAQLHDLYIEIGKPIVLAGKTPSAAWEKLVTGYTRLVPPIARTGEKLIEPPPAGPAYDSLLSETLSLHSSLGLGVLLPLRATIEKYATPEALTDDSFKTALSILITLQSEKVAEWLAKIPQKISKNPSESASYTPFLMSGYVLGAPLPIEKLPDSLSEAGADANPKDYALIALSSAYNGADLPFSSTEGQKYDKENLLTWLKNYVMHEGVDDDSLTKILESKHLGKVSLAAILALQQKPIGETSPKTLKTVLEGLGSVGLEDVARQILTESLLQQKLIKTGASQTSLEVETETKENPNHGTSRSPTTREAGSTSEH